jgi:hypothetical protein
MAVTDPSGLTNLLEGLAKLIQAGSTSELALVALVVVLLAFLALYLFRKDSAQIRLTVFFCLLATAIGFGAAFFLKDYPVTASLQTPTPTPAAGPTPEPRLSTPTPAFTNRAVTTRPPAPPNSEPRNTVSPYHETTQSVVGTWHFRGRSSQGSQGYSDISVQFLPGGKLRFSDDFYGQEGDWTQEGPTVMFSTENYSGMGVIGGTPPDLSMQVIATPKTLTRPQQRVDFQRKP